jgi:hypothetical protein
MSTTERRLSLDEMLELAKQVAVERRAAKAAALEAAKPAPVVTLAAANANVPLERQRERLSEATERLIEDARRRLAELKAHEAWVANWQRAIDFHMEMRLMNEEAERQLRRSDPCGIWSRAR